MIDGSVDTPTIKTERKRDHEPSIRPETTIDFTIYLNHSLHLHNGVQMSKFTLNDQRLTCHFLKAYSLSSSDKPKIKDTHMNRQFNTKVKRGIFVWNNIRVNQSLRDIVLV